MKRVACAYVFWCTESYKKSIKHTWQKYDGHPRWAGHQLHSHISHACADREGWVRVYRQGGGGGEVRGSHSLSYLHGLSNGVQHFKQSKGIGLGQAFLSNSDQKFWKNTRGLKKKSYPQTKKTLCNNDIFIQFEPKNMKVAETLL